VTSAQQGLPTWPAPYARQKINENELTNRTPEAHQWAVGQFRKMRNEGQFVPFQIKKETLVLPGFDGAAEWGGPALDPETKTIYVNSNEMAWTAALFEDKGSHGAQGIYLSQCTV
jgi:quinoprotein glucose dehydrogenase